MKQLLLATFFSIFCSPLIAQNDFHNDDTGLAKAQKVYTLIFKNGINEVSVKELKIMKLIDGFNRSYDKDWLKNAEVKGETLILRKDNGAAHYWYLEDAILIESTSDEIVVRI